MNNSSNKIESSGVSHIGPVRNDNQDSICLAENFGNNGAALFAVADGMGGYSNGKLASDIAINSLCETFKSRNGPTTKRLIHAIEAANLRIYQVTQEMGVGRMGTTLTAVYVDGNNLTVAHVGDSRAYLVRDYQVNCLTRDHTVVGDMVRMKVLSPDKVRTHAQRSVLTRGIGLSPFVHPDVTHCKIKEGDKLILCSDGLWSVIEDEELPKLSEESSEISVLINRLINLAIERGTDDNISAIGVNIQNLSTDSFSKKKNGWHRLWSLVKPS